MSLRSKQRTAQRRSQLTTEAMALRREAEDQKQLAELKARFASASQRDIDPYPTIRRSPLRYVKDKWGLTDSFTSNRRDRRAGRVRRVNKPGYGEIEINDSSE
jgi:hypothetical protein